MPKENWLDKLIKWFIELLVEVVKSDRNKSVDKVLNTDNGAGLEIKSVAETKAAAESKNPRGPDPVVVTPHSTSTIPATPPAKVDPKNEAPKATQAKTDQALRNDEKQKLFDTLKDKIKGQETVKDPESGKTVVFPKAEAKPVAHDYDKPIANFKEPAPVKLPSKPIDKVRVGIVVGHNSKAQGAMFNINRKLYPNAPRTEYQYHSILAEQYIKPWFRESGLLEPFIIYRTPQTDLLGAYDKAVDEKCELVIELHFNALNQRVMGTEVLCSTRKEDIQFATIMQKHLCKFMDRSALSRGISVLNESDRGGYAVYRMVRVPNVLTEAFFGDNPAEAKFAWENKKRYAQALRDACIEYAKAAGILKVQTNLT